MEIVSITKLKSAAMTFRKRLHLVLSLHTILVALFFCIVFAASDLQAGDVRGKVSIQRPAAINSKIVSRAIIRRYINKNLENPQGHDTHEEQPTIIVYIAGFRFGYSDGPEQVAVLDQINETFVPHVLPILAGTTVQFLNSDEVYHNVFSFSTAKSFDLGRYKTGKSRSVTFDKPGVVKVYCDIHTHMNAFILVLENPFFASTDENGYFEIKGVPPGKYTIKAWHGRWPEKSTEVIIEDSGVKNVNFEFP